MDGMRIVVVLLCKILGVPMLTQEDIDNQENNQGYYTVKFNEDDFYYER